MKKQKGWGERLNISCTPNGMVVVKHPKQGVNDILEAGFHHILLSLAMVCPMEELEEIISISAYSQRLYKRVKPFLDQCTVMQSQCTIAMAPYLDGDTRHSNLNDIVRQLTEESIKITGQCGSRYLVARPLFAGIEESDLWERNREYYLQLARGAQKYDVQLLLTNLCKDLNGHLIRGVCSDSRQAAQWIDALNEAVGEERFGFCMDVGVCNLCGQNMYDFILALGSRLKAVILRDNDGNSDSALLPFTAARQSQPQTDWLNLIRGLREIGFDGELILDFHDTASAFSPLLRPGLLRMAKSVADYFKWQIEIENQLGKYPSRVLFGAGNMCRNYMKCYGEKYPPLFTCDNNRNIWETEFCGLTVKSPETLRTLPEDCAVFICNIYYREIEAQLRQMGIKNPIAFFNDEYMPSFYFDRVEREKS